jgi:CRISPR-associated endonuclease Cas2
MHRLWLVSYDVACPRRRYRLDRLLAGLGDRVLESLWEARLRADQLPVLTARLQRLLKPGEDRLSLLPLCADCQRRLVRLGTDAPTPHRPGGDAGCTHGLGSSGAFKPYLVI